MSNVDRTSDRQLSASAVIETMQSRFTSGNSIPVERAHITQPEWNEITREILRLSAHISRRRDTLSRELEHALEEWKDCGARVVIAIGNLVQQGIDFVIAEFDDDEKAAT